MNDLAGPLDAPTAQAGGTHAPGCRFVPLRLRPLLATDESGASTVE
jgi:hypothetical protein